MTDLERLPKTHAKKSRLGHPAENRGDEISPQRARRAQRKAEEGSLQYAARRAKTRESCGHGAQESCAPTGRKRPLRKAAATKEEKRFSRREGGGRRRISRRFGGGWRLRDGGDSRRRCRGRRRV